MLFIRIVLSFFLLFPVVVPYQLNLHLTEWIDNNTDDIVVQHDCLRVNTWKAGEDPHEVTLYCISERLSKWNISNNTVDKIFTFADLSKVNITSEQLYLWSAPIDTVENYQLYLNQLLISNKTSMSTYRYYNCTLPNFGPMCQYSFYDYEPYYSSVSEIIFQAFERSSAIQMNLTCYIHLQCDLGLTSICIGWINICDGIVQCIDGYDEEHCWQLETNECNEDEFRCANGQCIPSAFYQDSNNFPDCFDGSDEHAHLKYGDSSYSNGPIFKRHELSCLRANWAHYSLLIGEIQMCTELLPARTTDAFLLLEKPDSIDDNCWLALNCYLKLAQKFNYSNCRNICEGETCKKIIANNCSDMFFMPKVPVAFGHIYFAYTKEYIINQTTWSNTPEYVCYNEQICGGFFSNSTLVLFNKTTCRRPQDFPLQVFSSYPGVSWVSYYIVSINKQLFKCSGILRNGSAFCNKSTMYQCINSSKCIAQIRLFDNRHDCDYGDDELPSISTNGNCPIKSPRMYVNCTITNTCISRKRFNNGAKDCAYDTDGLYDDEPSEMNYIRLHISFPHICDNLTHLKPILVNERYETDETECEQWPCNNFYTHCDGFFHCLNGEDELDCHPSSLIDCSSPNYVCFSIWTNNYTCLTADKLNDRTIDCVGGIDERNLCRDPFHSHTQGAFRCQRRQPDTCIDRSKLCDQFWDCLDGDDEKFCHNIENPGLFKENGICDSEDVFIRSDMEAFLCNHFKVFHRSKPVYFSLGRMRKTDKNRTKRDINRALTSLSANQIISQNQDHCHRHPRLRVWLNKDENLTIMTCLCPPSHYGDRCQYQNQRVSLTIQFRAFSDSWQTPFIAIISLIDDSNERTIHSYEQITYLQVTNCKTKYNIDLLYSNRSKNQSRQYSVHIDIYEKVSLSYRGSLLLSLPFPFLPVQRIAAQLNIPHTAHSLTNCSDHRCVHGRCIQYFDDRKTSTFCQCSSEWSGRYCNISHNCTCSSGSLCIGRLANNRSLCVCPMHKWGSKCLLHDNICQSNSTCDNGGQCIPVDRYVVSNKKFICICQKGYTGEKCEISQNKIVLSFEADMILPPSMLIHFIATKDKNHPENGTTSKNIPIDRKPVTIHWLHSFHIVFAEFIRPQKYYLIALRNTYNQSTMINTTLKSSNRCLNISEVFNETVSQFHLIRRIKYYHLPCQQHSPQLSCFYDEVHICLCTDFNHQRQANCFEFNHNLQRNCRGRSSCENGAQCLQDSINCPQTSICICPLCFYGIRCQFSSSGFSLSLDAILGYHIQPNVNIGYQPVIVHISMALSVLITVMGLLNGVLSMMTFMNKEPRKTGCGLYLLGSSITNLLISIVFCIKFWILLAAQITYMNNKSFLKFQCRSIDFLLRIGLNMDQWLNACVAIERALTVLKGVSFDQNKSKIIAKFVIVLLLLLTIATNIDEIIYRRLIDDESNDEKRIWCIITYSKTIQNYNLIINIFHFCTPFIINLVSAIIIIIKAARLRTAAKAQQNYQKNLLEQLQQHKHLLIGPVLLIILAIPRLIISFVSGCMQSSTDTDVWLFLIGYFISFIPPVLTFFIFVVPSKMYKEEFYNTVKRYQRSLRIRFRLFR